MSKIHWKEEDARRVMAEIIRVIVRPGEIWEGSGKALILFANEAQKEVLAKDKWRNLSTYASLASVHKIFEEFNTTPGIRVRTVKTYQYVVDPDFKKPVEPVVEQLAEPVPVQSPVVEEKLLTRLLGELVEMLVKSPAFKEVLGEILKPEVKVEVAEPVVSVSAANNTGVGLVVSKPAAELRPKTVLVIYGGRSIKDSLLRAFQGRKEIKLLPWFCEDNTNNLKAKLGSGNFDYVVYQTSVANHSIDAIIKSHLVDKRKLRRVDGNHLKLTQEIEHCLTL